MYLPAEQNMEDGEKSVQDTADEKQPFIHISPALSRARPATADMSRITAYCFLARV
jgi:hypothetical protein